jgi:hypothetical protein
LRCYANVTSMTMPVGTVHEAHARVVEKAG